MEVSVVVPAYNEAESLPELATAVSQSLRDRDWEMIVIDDGSSDETRNVLRGLTEKNERIRYLAFTRNYGKSAGLQVGFEAARGDVIITLDADLQDDPEEFEALLQKLDEGFDLVSGWKRVRHDPITKTLPSKLFNKTTSLVAGLQLHDFNCGLKAYRSQVAKGLPVYGELHRFLPALAHWQGYRVAEIPVEHHARKYGVSKFGPNRFINGILDLLTVSFVHSGVRGPLHIFGRVGMLLGIVGSGIFLGFVGSWITGHGVRMRPIFFVGLILILLAMQFVSLGLLGELIVKGQSKGNYIIGERGGFDR